MSGLDKNAPRIVTITPEEAASLLEHNKLNRPLRDAHVRRIAGQIIDGKWRFNGDTIKISDDGDVLDGQHRLWAIIEAKTSVPTILVYGIARDAFATIDTLRATRSGADVLALNGASRYRPTISAALTWLIRYQRKCLEDYRAPANRIENSDIEESFSVNPGMVRAVERCMALRGLANSSLLAFFYYIVFNRNPDLAEALVSTLENPAGISINDPFFRLRTYFTADHHKRKDPVVTIALMIKAANAAYEKKELRALSWRSQGSTPEAFPKLQVGNMGVHVR